MKFNLSSFFTTIAPFSHHSNHISRVISARLARKLYIEQNVNVHAKNDNSNVFMLGINLSQRPFWFQICFCSLGIFSSFVIDGLCEEYIFRSLNFNYAWYVMLMQSFVCLSLCRASGFRVKDRHNSWKLYVRLSFVLVFGMGLTKSSLKFINYPTQIIFKSSKIIPVMVMGRFIPSLKRKYTVIEYVSACVLVIGLIVFTLADMAFSPAFETIGLVMIMLALLFDAFLGNFQEAIFVNSPSTTQTEVLFCSTLAGLIFLIPMVMFTGEVKEAWMMASDFPIIYPITFAAALATFIGQVAILSSVALFGAATTYIITSLRKVITLCLSYIIFKKPFSIQHLLGLFLILISLNMRLCTFGKVTLTHGSKLDKVTLAHGSKANKVTLAHGSKLDKVTFPLTSVSSNPS